MTIIDIPAEVMADALKLTADKQGWHGHCDGVPDAIAFAYRAGRRVTESEPTPPVQPRYDLIAEAGVWTAPEVCR